MTAGRRRLRLRCFRHQDFEAQREMIAELEPRWYFTALTIAQENALPGTPQSVWDVQGAGDPTVQGFATDISINVGQTVSFKITDTTLASYHVDIYRLGYYQGNGARLVTSIPSAQCLKVSQPAPLTDASTGLVDCGNWSVTASWAIPADATSGVYIARVTRDDTGGASQIPFVVRNDASHAAILFQTSDSTWEAYNDWGGESLYTGGPVGRAYEVSYNRPFNNRADQPQNYIFGEEYPMIRFLEENGYDVTYAAGLDAERNPAELANHKVYMSVGHDEYWSGAQRTNVENARNNGLNIAFMSGNEVYWKTRWLPSTDSSATPYRTMVCYKESLIGSNTVSVTDPAVSLQYTGGGALDPSGIWTGLWRDQNALNTAEPDQELTGQIFSVNRGANGLFGTAIQVPSTDSMLRLWRNTSVAQLQPGQVATLAQGTLGYEWDEDVDNGDRPAGLIDMSLTTEGVPQKLIDPLSWPNCGGVLGALCAGCHGCMVAAASATHTITEYRAPGGALVFDAGTIQWSWGLDGNHDGGTTVPSTAMQQATVNLLADMSAQPSTLMAGLVAASQSTDTAAPTAVLTPPQNGTINEQGGFATISGTATDAGGGVVAGVEVSIDGGKTWHPAQGTSNWTYSWAPTSTGPIQVETRATDDSANLSAASGIYNAVVQSGDNSLYVWSNTTVPSVIDAADPNAIEVGMKFKTDVGGTVSAIRFYKGPTNTGTHIGHLWTDTGQLLGTVTFSNETTSGWQTANFSTPITIQPNTVYVVSYHTDAGNYSYTADQFASAPIDHASLHALAATDDPGGNGLYVYGADIFPTNSFNGGNYWVDVVFNPSSTVTVPTVTGQSPPSGAVDVAIASAISAQFNESIDSSTLSFVLTDPSGNTVPSNLTYSDTTHTATITPVSSLAYGTTYTATVYCSDKAGTPMTSKYNWTFTTLIANAPVTIWPDNITAPATANDSNPIEVGVKIRSDVAGYITGVRFYKGNTNTGTHTGSLWSSTGQLLATGTFTNESSSGWQTLTFANPVAIAANTTYVASYHSNVGNYSATGAYFSGVTAGSSTLHALADGVDGHDGVYVYGASAFPTNSYNATNYWVDAIFNTVATDITPPTVIAQSPAPNATGVATTATVTAQFSEAINTNALSFTLKDPSGNLVGANVSYNVSTHVATLTPAAALLNGTTYTATVSAMDLAGNAMTSPATWSFTTVPSAGGTSVSLWNAAATPATITVADTNAVELGMKFRTDVAGTITGMRFYKGPSNTGTHTGSLWSSTGQLLATGTFTNESSSGWQTLTFANPVAIAANTTYVISYHTNTGSYSANSAFFATSGVTSGPLHGLANGVDGSNGVYIYSGSSAFPTNSFNSANYWVDPIFSYGTADTTPPTVVSNSPTSTGVPINTTVSVTFSEPINPSGTGLSFVLKNSSGGTVATTQSYNSSSNTLTLTPQASLANGATYTATVSGAQDLAGNTLASPFTWSFTTVALTPPTVTAHTPATGATGVATNATVTVTFNEPVQLPTGSIVLRDASNNTVASTVTYNAATMTATLTPSASLNPTTTYTVTVSGVKDSTGQVTMTGSTVWSFTTVGNTTTQTSTTDFAAGTQGSTTVTNAAGGEVQLAQASSDDFTGTTLSSAWTKQSYASQGGGTNSVTVANSIVSIGGGTISAGPVTSASTFTTRAAFSGSAWQHFGVATSLADVPGNSWAIFSTMGTTNTLYARVDANGTTQDVSLGALPTGFHLYRIQPVSGGFAFYVDNVLKTTINLTIPTTVSMLAIFSDFQGTAPLQVDSVGYGAFASSGTFTSSVIDAGRTATWDSAAWTATVPANTTVTVQIAGSSDGKTFGAWQTLTNGSAISPAFSFRYVEYRVLFTTTDPTATPVFSDITLTWH